MKKFTMLLLSLLLAVTLLACGETETKGSDAEPTGAETSETETKTAGAGTFRVGYARNDVTPTKPVPLGGYGNTLKRMSTGFLDYTYTTCLALIDENENTLLLFTTDVIQSGDHHQLIKDRLVQNLGLPEENIIVTATHTHSNIDQSQSGVPAVKEWIENLVNVMEKTATEAIADASEATMQWTTCDLTGYNFVRHYFDEAGNVCTDNHDWTTGPLVKHTTESNHIMYLVKFCRAAEDKKDIMIANWRAHPCVTGGSEKTNISSDYIGQLRTNIEKSENVLFAYYQGEAGNHNAKTRLSQDFEYNPPATIKEYGKEVSDKIIEAMHGTWEDIPVGPIYTAHEIVEVEGNHEKIELKAIAAELYQTWMDQGSSSDLTARMKSYGLSSPYECSAIRSRSASGTTKKSIHATVIGELCITNLQAEQFDTNGTWIRDNSPSKFTLVMSYTDGNGYVPSQFAYDYGCYESDTTVCAPGSGEILAAKELDLLKQMWKKAGK